MAGNLSDAATSLYARASELLPLLKSSTNAVRSASCLEQFLQALNDEFDIGIGRQQGRLRPANVVGRTARSWQKALDHQKSKRAEAESALKEQCRAKLSGQKSRSYGTAEWVWLTQ